MSEEQTYTVAEMVRVTATNTNHFLTQIAEHIELLERTIVQLNERIVELEKPSNEA